jgi:hypothetical protein
MKDYGKLELQHVDLTEKLAENDSLLLEAKKVDLLLVSYMRLKIRRSRTVRAEKFRN